MTASGQSGTVGRHGRHAERAGFGKAGAGGRKGHPGQLPFGGRPAPLGGIVARHRSSSSPPRLVSPMFFLRDFILNFPCRNISSRDAQTLGRRNAVWGSETREASHRSHTDANSFQPLRRPGAAAAAASAQAPNGSWPDDDGFMTSEPPLFCMGYSDDGDDDDNDDHVNNRCIPETDCQPARRRPPTRNASGALQTT